MSDRQKDIPVGLPSSKPGIDPRLLNAFHKLREVCKKLGVVNDEGRPDMDFGSDEKDVQIYILGHEHDEKIDRVKRELEGVVRDNRLHLDVDSNQRKGTHYKFTLASLEARPPTKAEKEEMAGISESHQYQWPARVRLIPTTTQRKGVRSLLRVTEDVGRLSDIDDLFDELITAAKQQDVNQISRVGSMMKRLAEGSEALSKVILDAVNCAAYFDVNDVGYAYDRFRKLFFMKPIESPLSRFTASKGQAVVVSEQLEIESAQGTFIVPVGVIGSVHTPGKLMTIAFETDGSKLFADFTPALAGKYLRPVSSKLVRRLDRLLLTEDAVEAPAKYPTSKLVGWAEFSKAKDIGIDPAELKQIKSKISVPRSEDDLVLPQDLEEKLAALRKTDPTRFALTRIFLILYKRSQMYSQEGEPNIWGAIMAAYDILPQIPLGSSRSAYTNARDMLTKAFFEQPTVARALGGQKFSSMSQEDRAKFLEHWPEIGGEGAEETEAPIFIPSTDLD
jgi:hypothetical protein